MRHFKLFFVLTALFLSASVYAEQDSFPVPLCIQNHQEGHNCRVPAQRTIECFYESTMTSIITAFKSSIGTVGVVVENHTTGEYLSGTLSGEVGTQMIPISGTEGFYTITFTLQNGTQYYGEFEL